MTDVPLTRLPRFRLRLQAKVLALVLAFVGLPILLTGAYFLQQHHSLLSERGRERLANEVYRRAAVLDEWARQRQQESQRWAASFVIFEPLEGLERGDHRPDRARLEVNEFLDSLLPHHAAYESLSVLDTRGKVLASTRPEPLPGWMTALLEGASTEAGEPKGTVFGPPERTPQGRPSWWLLQPVKGRSDQVVGYIAGRLDVDELEGLLGGGEQGVAFWLLDSQGRVRVQLGRLAPEPGQGFFPASLQQLAQSGEAVHEGPIPHVGRALFSFRALDPPLGGHVVATLPASTAYASLAEVRRRLTVFGLLGTAAVLLLTWFAARRVLRPILLLSAAAQRVSHGETDVQLPVRGSDEISELTSAFNDMATRIRDSRLSLERAHDELARANRELTDANRSLETLAITDGLTGLYNRRHFQDVLERELARCLRDGKTLSLLMCDLDRFKAYNDRFGHPEGDALLRRVAATLTSSIRHSDMAFRYGGEELAVLLPACSKLQARQVAEKVRLAVRGAQDERVARFRGVTTISIGVATFPEDGRVARGLVDVADAALYAAKAGGRDMVVVAGEAPSRPPEGHEELA